MEPKRYWLVTSFNANCFQLGLNLNGRPHVSFNVRAPKGVHPRDAADMLLEYIRELENWPDRQRPPTVANPHPPVWPMVVADMQARDNFGRQKYGVPLAAFNGRDSMQDAYEEVLDLAVYLRTCLYERAQKACKAYGETMSSRKDIGNED